MEGQQLSNCRNMDSHLSNYKNFDNVSIKSPRKPYINIKPEFTDSPKFGTLVDNYNAAASSPEGRNNNFGAQIKIVDEINLSDHVITFHNRFSNMNLTSESLRQDYEQSGFRSFMNLNNRKLLSCWTKQLKAQSSRDNGFDDTIKLEPDTSISQVEKNDVEPSIDKPSGDSIFLINMDEETTEDESDDEEGQQVKNMKRTGLGKFVQNARQGISKKSKTENTRLPAIKTEKPVSFPVKKEPNSEENQSKNSETSKTTALPTSDATHSGTVKRSASPSVQSPRQIKRERIEERTVPFIKEEPPEEPEFFKEETIEAMTTVPIKQEYVKEEANAPLSVVASPRNTVITYNGVSVAIPATYDIPTTLKLQEVSEHILDTTKDLGGIDVLGEGDNFEKLEKYLKLLSLPTVEHSGDDSMRLACDVHIRLFYVYMVGNVTPEEYLLKLKENLVKTHFDAFVNDSYDSLS